MELLGLRENDEDGDSEYWIILWVLMQKISPNNILFEHMRKKLYTTDWILTHTYAHKHSSSKREREWDEVQTSGI